MKRPDYVTPSSADETPLQPICDTEQLMEVLVADQAVLFKHSPACWLSLSAHREMEAFAQRTTELSVYLVDVLEQAALSREIEQILGVKHESPQVILVRSGRRVWSASHRGVTAAEVAAALQETSPS